jgi:hypothetical protein
MDYDGDGDLDLFAGSRSQPQDYGTIPASYLLQNDGQGNFTDVTATVAPAFLQLGMLTAAKWLPLQKDAIPVLTVVGEWMAPRSFQYQQGVWKEVDNGLSAYKGWWQSMAADDLDNDGDIDFVVGNLGENFYLRPTTAQPARLWVKDFDKNGISDKIITQTIGGKDMPVFTKREITDQLPSLKKDNLIHAEFAKKSVQELFGKNMQDAVQQEVNCTYSIVAINNGQGQFTVQQLPLPIQLTSLNAIQIKDINKDGYKDLVTAGNFFDVLPQFCRLDAGYGQVLINNKKGGFTALAPEETGLRVRGAVRGIAVIKKGTNDLFIFLQNNDQPVAYLLAAGK